MAWKTGSVPQQDPVHSTKPEPSPRAASTPDGTLTQRNPYRVILSNPGAVRFSVTGAVARLPMSMVGLGIVLMLQGLYGSYAVGGRVSAVYLIVQAFCSPQIARLVDRHGQSKVMRPLVLATAVSMMGLIAAALAQAPEAVLMALAAAVGASIGSVGAMVRARWSYLLDDPAQLHTAFSLESAIDEMVFVIGPVLATSLATRVHPAAGLVLPVLAAGLGGWWFLMQRDTEPPARQIVPGEHRQPSVLRSPGLVALCLIFVLVGGIFGAVDVSTIAFAEEHGNEGIAGLILAAFALGSLTSGLGYGLRNWRSPLTTRLTLTMTGLTAGIWLFLLADSTGLLALMMFVAGFAIAPTMITGNNLVQILVPERQLTEGLTWVATALGIGISVGTSIAGTRIDSNGAHAGFLVATACASVGLLMTVAAVLLVNHRRRRTTSG